MARSDSARAIFKLSTSAALPPPPPRNQENTTMTRMPHDHTAPDGRVSLGEQARPSTRRSGAALSRAGHVMAFGRNSLASPPESTQGTGPRAVRARRVEAAPYDNRAPHGRVSLGEQARPSIRQSGATFSRSGHVMALGRSSLASPPESTRNTGPRALRPRLSPSPRSK